METFHNKGSAQHVHCRGFLITFALGLVPVFDPTETFGSFHVCVPWIDSTMWVDMIMVHIGKKRANGRLRDLANWRNLNQISGTHRYLHC
jgi:hypothetical protein